MAMVRGCHAEEATEALADLLGRREAQLPGGSRVASTSLEPVGHGLGRPPRSGSEPTAEEIRPRADDGELAAQVRQTGAVDPGEPLSHRGDPRWDGPCGHDAGKAWPAGDASPCRPRWWSRSEDREGYEPAAAAIASHCDMSPM